jgi:hypothetical protein
MEAQAAQLFDPIKAALNGTLDTTALFELYMPVNAFRGRKSSEVATIQQALIDWFVSRICGQRLARVVFPVRDIG